MKSNTIFFVNLQKNKIVMKDSVIIVSGGLDSITLLYDKAETIALAISFDYGQNHGAKELPYAQYHCEKLGIPHITIPLSFMHQYFKSSLLDGADAIPEGHYEEENMKSTVVPFRNGIMLAIATGIAESHELRRVYIANHGGDHTIYPDCRPEITKAEIVARGAALGIDYSKTWSCYKGADIHCGKCGTCVERKEAFEAAGVKDPTIYNKE